MIRNAVILHGCPEKQYYYDPAKPSESNAHWLPWLQKELIIRDIKADTPEIPHAYEPDWQTWCKEVERFDITSDTILVGHSAGGGFWLRYLSEHANLRVGKVVLVGPWLDPNDTIREAFFDFAADKNLVARTEGVTVFHADDDGDSVQRTLEYIRSQVPGCNFIKLNGYGHFKDDNLGGQEFPELLQEIVGQQRPHRV